MRTQRLRDVKWLLRVIQVTPDNCPKLERPGMLSSLPDTYPQAPDRGNTALPNLETVYGIDPAYENP